MEMLDRAVQSGATPETLEKLMALQERWEANQARRAFDSAIADAKAEIPPILRTTKGHNAKKYADFAAIARVVDPILPKHGLSYRFRSIEGDRINVTCILSHRSGHSEQTTLSGPADTTGNKNAVQAIGSTLTYLQRYTLVQMLGLAAADDDDGKSSGTALLTQEQADALHDLLESTGAPKAKFLKWAKVEKVEDIAAEFYDSCVDAIKRAATK
jgi:hypothetical protein